MNYFEKVSIIVPVYNVDQYLEQCLNSIIEQTYKNIEVIVVNDGSTDSSYIIIEQFAKKDSRVKVINQINSGLSAARNTGIAIAKGNYIMFVDGDDWIDFNMVERLFLKLINADLVACSYYRAYQKFNIPRVFDIDGIFDANFFQRRLTGLIGEELKDPSLSDCLVTAWGKLFKAEIIKDNNLEFVSTREIGTEDLLFNLEYASYASKVYISNEPLYMYRRNNISSLTSTYKPSLFNQWSLLFKLIENKIVSKGFDFDLALNNRIALSIIGLGLNELQNPKGFRARYHNLKTILKSPLHKKSYHQLELKYFPLHWKIFFFFAKCRMVLGVYFMLIGIRFMVNRHN
jgi:glycosyltransferase EpsH